MPTQTIELSVPDTACARRTLARELAPDIGAFIGGRWDMNLSGELITLLDPATGEEIRKFRGAAIADVDRAVAAATDALASWRLATAPERAGVLRSLGAIVREHADELALLTSLENGTPFEFSRHRMKTVPTAWFEHYAGWCDKLAGDTLPRVAVNQFTMTVLEPVGVVAKLVTWNSPIGGIQMSLPAALAAGCTIILRPPEVAPLAITRFGQLCEEAGVPPGVIGILPGGADTAEALVRHPSVGKVSFTGGPEVARRIQRTAAESLKPLVLELGGKSANIVFDDADVGAVVAHALMAFGLSGQGCAVPSRLIVHEDVYGAVVDAVVAAVATMRVGDPFDDETRIGPLISASARERVLGMIRRAEEEGATVACGGTRSKGMSSGYFVEPTVLLDVDPDSEIAQREVFGPVLSVMRFAAEDEAVAIANGTDYGLAAYVHTTDLDRVLRMVERLEAGTVAVNGAAAPVGYHAPFGGVKDSGYGTEGGREGVMEFTHVKTVSINTVPRRGGAR